MTCFRRVAASAIVSQLLLAVVFLGRSLREREALQAKSRELAIWARGGAEGAVHHSGRVSHYLSIRYMKRLTEGGLESSVGSRGDTYEIRLGRDD